MGIETRRVSVSLRGPGGTGSQFLAEYEVRFRGGSPEPLDYSGRRYAHSHTVPPGGYEAGTQPEVYVFDEIDGVSGAQSTQPAPGGSKT